MVYVGDVIICVNEIDILELSYENVVELLKVLLIDVFVVFLLWGFEGYFIYFEIIF